MDPRTQPDELERLRAENARLRELLAGRKPAAPGEGRLRKLIEHAWDVVLLHDSTGQVTYANPAVSRVLGYSPDELAGLRISTWVHPDDRDSLQASLYSIARQQGASTVVRFRARHSRGHWCWLEAAHTNLLQDDSVAAVVAICRDVSDRVAVEEELRTKDAALASSRAAIAFADPTGAMVYVNDAMLAMWGFDSRAEVLGRHCTDFWDAPGGAENAMRSVLAKGSWHGMLQGRRKDGVLFQTEVNASLVRNAQGAPQMMMASIIDVTERELAIAALRESESRFRALVEQAADAIAVMSPQGRYVDCNEAACRLLGYSRPELMSLGATDIVAPQFGRAPDFSAVQVGRRLLAEFPLRRKDGSVFIAEVSSTRLSDGTILGIIRDIEERRRAERSLRESEQRFRELAETAEHVFWITELDPPRVVFLSTAFEQIWGRPVEYARARPHDWLESVHPEDRDRVQAAYKDWLQSKLPRFEAEYRIVRPDGQVRWISDSGTLTQSRPGEPLRATGIARDITARKKAELALRESERALAALVANLPGMAYRCANQPQWPLTFVGGRVMELTGYPADAFLSGSVQYGDLIHEEDAQRVWDTVQTGVAARKPFEITYRIHARDGTLRWVWEQGVGVFDGPGKLLHLEGIIQDISARKAAELALAERENRLRVIVDTLSVPLMISRPDGGTVLYCNRPQAALVGLAPAEMMGRQTPEFYANPQNRSELIERLQREGSVHGFELGLRHADGSTRWVLGSMTVAEYEGAPAVFTTSVDITERKRIQAAHEEAGRRLQGIVDSLTTPLTVTRVADGRILYANQAIATLMGIPLGELKAHKSPEFYADPTAREQLIHALKQTGELRNYEVAIKRATGELRWVMLSACLSTYGGEPAIYASAVDITQRRTAEQALQESESRFRQLAETIQQVYWITETEPERVLYVSPAFERIWGLSPQALYADPHLWITAIHPQDLAAVQVAFSAWIHGHAAAYDVQYRIVRPDGTTRWIADTGFRTPGTDGRPGRVCGVARDITEEREASQAYRLLVDHSLQGFAIVQQGKIVFANARLGEIMGRDPAEICRMPLPQLLELVHQDDRPEVSQRLQALMSGSTEVRRTEYRVLRPNGELRWLESYSMRVEYRGAPAVQTANVDITDQRRLEEQLRQTQKIESIGRLAGGVAHDFNNLLTVVLGFAELMSAKAPKDTPLAGYADNVLTAARRGADLTRQLLAFARKQILQPKLLALNDLVRGAEPLLRRALRDDMELVLELRPGIGQVRVDPSQFEQVLLNLAVNARDAMRSGGRLTIGTESVTVSPEEYTGGTDAPPGRYACLTITDTGTGMTPEVMEHLFEPFFTTKGPGEGTGLGLASVYGTVRQGGGYIRVESAPGKGTRFAILLPPADALQAP